MNRNLWSLMIYTVLVTCFSLSVTAQNLTNYTCPTQTHFNSPVSFTLAEVEAAVGFQHPVLQEIVQQPMNDYADSYSFSVVCTPYNQTIFIGLVYLVNDPFIMRVQLLTENAGQIQLRATYDFENQAWLPHTITLDPFGDRNFNGLPDFAVSGQDGAKGRFDGRFLLELNRGEIQDITPAIPAFSSNIGFDDFDDFNHDGIPEMRVKQFYFVPTIPNTQAGIQRFDQWWAWNGRAYQLVAVQVPSFAKDDLYDYFVDSGEEIEDYLADFSGICAAIVKDGEQPDYGGVRHRAFDVLLYYRTWADMPTAWAKLQPLLDAVTACEDSDGKTYFFTAIEQFRGYFAEPDT